MNKRIGIWGDYEAWQISARWYKLIYIKTVAHAVIMTGSDVTTVIRVPFTFVLNRIHLYHMTSTPGTASKDATTLTLRRPQGGISNIDYFIDDFYKMADITDSKFIITFEDLNPEGGMVMEASTVQVILNSTSTDLIQPIIYLKRLD